jgi:hypothetical protein
MIDESSKLIALLIGVAIGWIIKERKPKTYMIEEFSKIKKG